MVEGFSKMIGSKSETLVTISQMSLAPHISMFGSSDAIMNSAKKVGAEQVQILPTRVISREVLYNGKLLGDTLRCDFHWSWAIDTELELAEGREPKPLDILLRRRLFFTSERTDEVMAQLMKRYPNRPITIHSLGDANTLGRLGTHPFQLELVPQNMISLSDLLTKIRVLPSNTLELAFPIEYTQRDEDQFALWRARNVPVVDDRSRYSWTQMFGVLKPYIGSLHVGPLNSADIRAAASADISYLSDSEKQVRMAYQLGFKGNVVLEVNPQKIMNVQGGVDHDTTFFHKIVRSIKGYREIQKTLMGLTSRLRRVRDEYAQINLTEV
jgi:hypothetical protein